MAVDVGKSSLSAMACDFTVQMLVAPVDVAMDRAGLAALIGRVTVALPARVCRVRVVVEAAGHYHLPVIAAGAWPAAWEVVTLNPAQVTAQRRVNGSRTS